MNTTEVGKKAEAAARVYLEMRGFQIMEQNWRRPQAEIDIIARKDDVMHFVEVKYRAGNQQGGGLEAITPAKLRRMQRGAILWTEESKWPGEYVLSGIEIAGAGYSVLNFVENIW
jgi:putative endonuclease